MDTVGQCSQGLVSGCMRSTGEQACSHAHLNAKRLAQASVQACRLSTAYQDQKDLSRACNS